MRWWPTILLACILLVACSPTKAGEGLLEKSGFDAEATGHVVAGAFESTKTCAEDFQCDVGRICVNNTCQPKPRE